MIKKVLPVCLALALTGCGHLHPYHAPLQQGNILEAKNVNQLRTGMSREEVIALMGTPVSKNLFNDQQLPYIYTYKPNNGPLVYKRVIITLQNNRVVNIEKYSTLDAY